MFDLGGGTFDVTLLAIDGGVFEVKATGNCTPRIVPELYPNCALDSIVPNSNRRLTFTFILTLNSNPNRLYSFFFFPTHL